MRKRLIPNTGGGAYPAFKYTIPCGYVAPNAGNTVPITTTTYDPGVTYNGISTQGDSITFGTSGTEAWVAGTPMYRQANFYWEIYHTGGNIFVGMSRGTNDIYTSIKVYSWLSSNGRVYNGGSSSSYSSAWPPGTTLSVLYNTSGDLAFYINGYTGLGNAFTGITSYAWYPFVGSFVSQTSFQINLVGG